MADKMVTSVLGSAFDNFEAAIQQITRTQAILTTLHDRASTSARDMRRIRLALDQLHDAINKLEKARNAYLTVLHG